MSKQTTKGNETKGSNEATTSNEAKTNTLNLTTQENELLVLLLNSAKRELSCLSLTEAHDGEAYDEEGELLLDREEGRLSALGSLLSKLS